MRTIIFICLLLPTLAIGQQRGFKPVTVKIEGETVELYTQSHALVIGISKYTNGWPSLPGVNKDIDEIKKALESNDFNVVVAKDLNKDQMDKAFTDFIAKYGQDINNRLLFYFAGHGHTVKTTYGDKLGYVVPSDAPNPNTNQTEFQSKSMEMAQIEIYAKRIQSKHALFLFDACFSGALFSATRAVPEIISYKTREPVRQFITSGNEDETVPDKSIFREQFVVAITTDYGDSNKDGYLTGTELGEFLQTNVINYSRSSQHPQYGKIRHPALDKGDYVFPLPSSRPSTPVVEKRDVQPQIGTVASVVELGTVELTTEISGDLYLDGNKLIAIQANTVVPISRLATGNHTLEVRSSSDNWQGNVFVVKDQVARITATKGRAVVATVASGTSPAFVTDSRDGVTYKAQRIGNLNWMSENINYGLMSETWCYDDNKKNCPVYGRLYTWEMAKAACPAGWRLPTKGEVEAMLQSMGENEKKAYSELIKISPNFNKFSGIRTDKKAFTGFGVYSNYWTSTPGSDNHAWSLKVHTRFKSAKLEESSKDQASSVRCVLE
jgi:uncharacterized protein (TIGR02145 family)